MKQLKPVLTVVQAPPSCANCQYMRHNGAYDECKRYPQAVRTTAADWCGEHKRKPEKA